MVLVSREVCARKPLAQGHSGTGGDLVLASTKVGSHWQLASPYQGSKVILHIQDAGVLA